MCVIGEIQRNIRVRYVPIKGIMCRLCHWHFDGANIAGMQWYRQIPGGVGNVSREVAQPRKVGTPGSSCRCDTHGQPVFWPIEVFNVILSLIWRGKKWSSTGASILRKLEVKPVCLRFVAYGHSYLDTVNKAHIINNNNNNNFFKNYLLFFAPVCGPTVAAHPQTTRRQNQSSASHTNKRMQAFTGLSACTWSWAVPWVFKTLYSFSLCGRTGTPLCGRPNPWVTFW